MIRYLLMAHNQPDLWHYLKQNFAGDEKVEVILDRKILVVFAGEEGKPTSVNAK